jgi:hypothetical protein
MSDVFPKWTNQLPLKIAVCGVVIVCGLTAGTWYYITPKYTRVGYQPIQPVPFPHDLHVSQLGMDCRYCHSFVDVAAHSNLPNTQTCMACHSQGHRNPKLEPVRASWKPAAGQWVNSIAHPITFITPRCARNRGIRRELSRADQSYACRLSRQAAQHGVVSRMPSASGKFSAARDPNLISIGNRERKCLGLVAGRSTERCEETIGRRRRS